MSVEAIAASSAAPDEDGFDWMMVEIFGHRSHCGRGKEVERFGTKMLRIDVPTFPAARSLFDAADGKPEQPAIVWQTRYYGGSSIFSFTLTDEASVMRANRPYEQPSRVSLPAPVDHDDDGFDDDDTSTRD